MQRPRLIWQNDRRTPNDFDDSDTGPNQLQNYPVFTWRDGAALRGHFKGLAGTTYSLDLYTYRTCDVEPWPGYGEGKTWLATQDVPTDLHGNAVFTLTLPGAPGAGHAIAGTLTDPDGNTSEFSNAPYRLQAVVGRGPDAVLYADLDPLQREALLGCLPTLELSVMADGDGLSLPLQALGEQRFALNYTLTHTLTQTLDLYFNAPGDSTSYFADRIWLLPGPQVTFYEPDFPKLDVLAPVGEQGTVDGNQVTIEISVTNPGPETLTPEVLLTDVATGAALPGKFISPAETTQHTLPAGQTTTLTFLWDTTGAAWNDAQQPVYTRTVRVTLLDQNYHSVVIRPAEAEINVRPRPAVLVHGLWSNAQDTWSNYQGFLNSVRSDWKAYAVGDGQAPGVMNTGDKFHPYGESNRLSENAAILRQYVEGVREAENAWHVDLVAHSMGGLISRYYLSNLIWDRIPQDGYPVVNHLVMLGTPNLGSPCSYMVTGLVKVFGGVFAEWVYGDPWDPVIKDLMPHRLEYYNHVWRQSRNVPYSIWAGTKVGVTCYEPVVGDLVTPLPSAYGQAPNGPLLARMDKSSIIHTAMTGELSDFQQYVLPLLAAGPARAHERTLPPGPANVQAFDAQAAAALYEAAPPQILWNQWLDVPAGETGVVTFTVPVGEALAVTLVASDTVTATLLDAAGAPAGDFTGPLFRTVWTDDPITGTWTVAVTNTDVATVSVTLAAALIGAEEELALTVDEPDWEGLTRITATLASPARALAAQVAQATEILTMTARLTNDAGDELLVNLEDNGAGVFSAPVGPLDPDLYDLFVYAVGPDFYRGTTGGVNVPLARISKMVEAEPGKPVRQGDPLIYTVVITAAPGTELGFFDPLQDVIFLDFIDEPPAGIVYIAGANTGGANSSLSGTITIPAEHRFIFSFFAQVAAPELADELTIANSACVYPAAGSVDDCIWSRPAETIVQVVPPVYPIYLPVILRNYRPMPVHTFQTGTYFGGGGDDMIYDMAVGPDDYLYLTGETYSTDLGPESNSRSFSNVFVAKLAPDGKTLIYYTMFGGAASGAGKAIAVDAAGNAYVTGYTLSATFPRTTGAFDTELQRRRGSLYDKVDAFVTKLDAAGNIVYSSYLGGSGYNVPGAGAGRGRGCRERHRRAWGLLSTSSGETESDDFPTTPGAYDRVYADVDWGLNADIFIVKMRLAGQGSADLIYGTYLGGGASFEEAGDLAVDSAGRLYITGNVEDRYSTGGFPLTPGAVDTAHPSGWWVTKAFLIKFNPVGGGQSDLLYSTYLGGTGTDEGHALALGA
jgi:pimeloyl-ACP methyl ester carboxylesterase